MTSDKGVEVSERCSGVFVNNGGINMLQVIVDKSFGIVDNLVTDGVFYTYENRQPFVVRNVLVFRDCYASCFLENCLIVPLRVEFC